MLVAGIDSSYIPVTVAWFLTRFCDLIMGLVGVYSLELQVLECCVEEMDEEKLIEAVTDLQ